MKIHFSCSNEAEYIRLRPVLTLLKGDKSLQYREKTDKQGRKQIYFVPIKRL